MKMKVLINKEKVCKALKVTVSNDSAIGHAIEEIVEFNVFEGLSDRTFNDLDKLCKARTLVDGEKEPERLHECAEEWNNRIVSTTDYCINVLTELRAKHYPKNQPYDMLAANILMVADRISYGTPYAVVAEPWEAKCRLDVVNPADWVLAEIEYPANLV